MLRKFDAFDTQYNWLFQFGKQTQHWRIFAIFFPSILKLLLLHVIFFLRCANKFTIFGEIFSLVGEKKNDFQTQNSLVYSCSQKVQLQHWLLLLCFIIPQITDQTTYLFAFFSTSSIYFCYFRSQCDCSCAVLVVFIQKHWHIRALW